MMDQFFEIKEQHPDTILFFRMGDFYELFHEDAEIASEVLGLSLTSRDKNAENPIPMAGFPWHGLMDHLKTMMNAGYKVTVADQEEELREGAKLLERVVTRIYTPGSLFEDDLLDSSESRLLGAICALENAFGCAIIDVSTGTVHASSHVGENGIQTLHDEVMRWSPVELIVSSKDAQAIDIKQLVQDLPQCVVTHHHVNQKKGLKQLEEALNLADLGHIDLDAHPSALHAAALAMDYLSKVLQTPSLSLTNIELANQNDGMVLDQTTLRNLELITTLAGEHEGSLLSVLNQCRTAMGRRTLKQWLLKPLASLEAIQTRQNAVDALRKSSRIISTLHECLKGMRDVERLATQLMYDRCHARDLLATADAIERMPGIKQLCEEVDDPFLTYVAHELDSIQGISEIIRYTIVDEPPFSIRDGGIIRPGVDEEIDRLANLSGDGRTWFNDLETALRNQYDIPSLKVKHNRQIGWHIEVTKTHEGKIPEEWRRKQQMSNGSRYVTDEIIKRDDEYLSSDSKLKELHYRKFLELRAYCKTFSQQLAVIAHKIATIDVILCFATLARTHHWVKPEMVTDHLLSIKEGRHPVLERHTQFVPNHLQLDSKRRFLLITGPNMGGKSTYLRTAALLTILAQCGCFVPAKKAKIGLVDRVFTRVGASDDLMKGRSTFMMEMIEVAHILKHATSRSLILLDEIGRGTSTFDGLSLAWSVTEDVCKRIQARTLFATHYHQLIGLEHELKVLANVHVQVDKQSQSLRFLHTVAEGPCDDSYGIQVGALAGLPRHVIERASDLLGFLERQAGGAKAGSSGSPVGRDAGQASLMGYIAASMQPSEAPQTQWPKNHQRIIDELQSIEMDDLSPREAFQRLEVLKQLSKDE